MEKRTVRCNYEKVCKSNGMHKDPREFCVRCTRYVPHDTHVLEHDQIPNFMKDYSLTIVDPYKSIGEGRHGWPAMSPDARLSKIQEYHGN